MTQEIEIEAPMSDSAAVFGAALSLRQACREAAARDPHLNLSDCYNGMDEFMREVMRVGNLFEDWACGHVAFEEHSEVWPYFLEDKFGAACLAADAAFRMFRIQTARDAVEGGFTEPFTADDDPSDEEMGEPYFSLYGVGTDGLLEHIADRRTYSEAVTLAGKIAPGIEFPTVPVVSPTPPPPAC